VARELCETFFLGQIRREVSSVVRMIRSAAQRRARGGDVAKGLVQPRELEVEKSWEHRRSAANHGIGDADYRPRARRLLSGGAPRLDQPGANDAQAAEAELIVVRHERTKAARIAVARRQVARVLARQRGDAL